MRTAHRYRRQNRILRPRRIFANCEWNGHDFLLVDTGGIEPMQQEKMSWWWLLIIALLGVTGEEMYRRNKKKKAEAAQKDEK